MKKIMILFLIVITIMLAGCKSCKPDPPVDDGLIKLTELEGTWNFVSFNYDGTDYNCSSVILPENITGGFTDFVFNTSEMIVQRKNDCFTNVVELDFTKNVNVIKFDRWGDAFTEIYYVYTVLSYDGNELKLRIDQTPSLYAYLGGTLTLIK